jgi:hypothetical protein
MRKHSARWVIANYLMLEELVLKSLVASTSANTLEQLTELLQAKTTPHDVQHEKTRSATGSGGNQPERLTVRLGICVSHTREMDVTYRVVLSDTLDLIVV